MAVVGPVLAVLFLTSAQHPTDFGIRMAPGEGAPIRITKPRVDTKPLPDTPAKQLQFDLASAVDLGRTLGRVTSTKRSVAHNRAVGGAPRSFHLSARAIDIARHSGVRHAQIESAYRKAGYHLIESLDEGDHSHFAFGTGSGSSSLTSKETDRATNWRIVYAPR